MNRTHRITKLEKARLEWFTELLMQIPESEQETAYHKMLAFVSGLHYAWSNSGAAGFINRKPQRGN